MQKLDQETAFRILTRRTGGERGTLDQTRKTYGKILRNVKFFFKGGKRWKEGGTLDQTRKTYGTLHL